ncbi:MAG TPA: secondary thiamine-phosphate synthase enzyme YjbQ [archaeon]|nr:secondary thiamine-phosphate synthase enzyme YjbQ [archaeon]
MIELSVESSKRNELIDVTLKISGAVLKSGIVNGACIVYVPHTTASLTVNEGHDPDVTKDILKKLNELVPKNENHAHAEGNSDSHIKALLVGSSVTIIVEKGKLCLGRWQKVFFCEFDGPRERTFWVQTLAGDK